MLPKGPEGVVDAAPNQSTHKKKRLPILATWEPKIGYQTKFVSVHTESFAVPSGQSSVQVDEQVILQRNALEKFSRFACNNFGSALRMFESVGIYCYLYAISNDFTV